MVRYATFGHSAESLDMLVSPADDERDNVANFSAHCRWMGNALYEYLPALSRGTREPRPTARLELTTVELVPGTGKAFEAALGAGQSALQSETLWYRMVAGGPQPRMSDCVPIPTCHRFSKAAANRRFRTGLFISSQR